MSLTVTRDRCSTLTTMAESAITKRVAGRIVQLREQRGMSQETLAAQARINRVTLARLELGQHQPKLETLERLAGVLGVSLVSLLK
jgi:transcriptional regulator with XRE-family HTH domain